MAICRENLQNAQKLQKQANNKELGPEIMLAVRRFS